VPESADFVMHWWQRAADLTRTGALRRFGLITTNSIRQTFNRRVISAALEAKPPLFIGFAIPDHPWTDASDGAAVRIAMTVGSAASGHGGLLTVTQETDSEESEGVAVNLAAKTGAIHADLSIGANVAGAVALQANTNVSSRGHELGGAGFIVTPEEAEKLAAASISPSDSLIRQYRNGRDLTDTPRGVRVIDAFGLTAEQLRDQDPAVYQWLLERVKPERDQNRIASVSENWWLHRRLRIDLRSMANGLPRYIATVETAKHRTFQFLDASILPDNKLIAIALSDAAQLAVLSSRLHGGWAIATGSWLGVGNDQVYVKTRCFETFPFPNLNPEQQQTLAELGERLDAHRKRALSPTALPQAGDGPKNLTLTGMYNVLVKLRRGEALNAKEKLIHEQGLCSVLKELHDSIDRAVLAAYGWADLAPLLEVVNGNKTGDRAAAEATLNAELLTRLAALNAERVAEEARGQIRWLRPDYQNPQAAPVQTQAELVKSVREELPPANAAEREQWPEQIPQQVGAVARVLAASPVALSVDAIAARFKGKGAWKKRLPQILETLEAVGRVQKLPAGWCAAI